MYIRLINTVTVPWSQRGRGQPRRTGALFRLTKSSSSAHKRSPRLKMQHRWRHERRFQKKMQARLFLSTHTTTKNWWECLLRSPLSTSYWDLLYNMGLILTATKIWRLSLRISPSSDFRLTASGETSSTFLHIASQQRQKFCSNLSLRWPTSWKLINTDPGCTNQNQNGKGAKTSNSNSGCKKL